MDTIDNIIQDSWNKHQELLKFHEQLSVMMYNSLPILWFGNIDAYSESERRIVTVGLNPSSNEFDGKTDRFPLAHNLYGKTVLTSKDCSIYYDAMNAYFENKDGKRKTAYTKWFNHFEKVLNCLDASYYSGNKNRAVHIDIYSPFATNPTWGNLSDNKNEAIKAASKMLYDRMVDFLKPDIVLISVGKNEMDKRYSDVYFDSIVEADKNGRFYLKIAKDNGKVVIWGFNNQGTPFGLHKKDAAELQEIMNKVIKDYKL